MKTDSYDEMTIKDIVARMVDAWNRGNGAAFAAPFAAGADFIAFDGTRLTGREEIGEFHQQLFDRELAGTRLDGAPVFVRFLGPALAIMHAWGTMTLKGEPTAAASRDSMQLFIVHKQNGDWLCDALLNARRVTADQQVFQDEFATLSLGDQREVTQRVASMRH